MAERLWSPPSQPAKLGGENGYEAGTRTILKAMGQMTDALTLKLIRWAIFTAVLSG
jgi:hypothetical protein